MEYQKIVEANARHQLGLILFHKNGILQKVIEDGLSEKTATRERLVIRLSDINKCGAFG